MIFKFLDLNDLSAFNTCESVIDTFKFNGNNLEVLMYNILDDNILGAKYFFLCKLVFKEVKTVTFDYEISRKMTRRECVGGTDFDDVNKYYEFWVDYNKIDLFLTKESSSISYDLKYIQDNKLSQEAVEQLFG